MNEHVLAGAKSVREIAGASHALSVSAPDAVAETILEAVAVSQRVEQK